MSTFAKTELRTTVSLAAILSFRMLGLFMILPVFTLYAENLRGTTPTLIGFALGIYGLFQALFQMPLGMLSDRWGRKTVICLGLLIFAFGSIVAALSTSIYGVILGRALQGGGAVGSTIIALVADLTRPEHRTKAMAILGITIGLSFAVAIVLGPLLNAWIHVSGIFWVTALLALIGIILLFTVIPTHKPEFHSDAEPNPAFFKSVLLNKRLLPLNLGIFFLHAILTASFVALPLMLRYAGLRPSQQWYFYLAILLMSFLMMMPLIIRAEKRKQIKLIYQGAIAAIFIAQLGLWGFQHSLAIIVACLFLFFVAFNLLEASLPSLISKIAPASNRGTVMGVYSSFQFLGIFVGGSLGGWILAHTYIPGVFAFCAILTAIWLIIAVVCSLEV